MATLSRIGVTSSISFTYIPNFFFHFCCPYSSQY